MSARVETPRGAIIRNSSGTVQLEWNPNFRATQQRRFNETQKVIDSEVLRVCEPYIPLVSSMLIKSGILGTTFGTGEVQWIVPYARRVYYSSLPIGRETGPLRGRMWFDRAMIDHKDEIIRKAGRKFGGRAI